MKTICHYFRAEPVFFNQDPAVFFKRAFFISLIVKILLATLLPLTSDEAYYWVWSHHLQWSYYDHPPLVAWLFWLGHPFENFFSAVRLPAIVFGHLALLFWWMLLKKQTVAEQFPQALNAFVFLYLFAPFSGVGSLIVTPDIPLMVFWPLSLLLFSQYFNLQSNAAKPKNQALTALLLGLSLGLGLLSKYMMVLFGPCVVWILWQQRFAVRTWLRHVPLLLFGFSLTSSPIWIWNYQHDWISFHFQAGHGLGSDIWKWRWTTDYVFIQLLFITPPVLYYAWRSKQPHWLRVFAFFPLIFFFFTSFRGYVEANWPIVAHPALLALATLGGLPARWSLRLTQVWAVIVALLLSLIFHMWLPLDKTKVKLKEFYLFNEVIPELQGQKELYARSYQMASTLSFELKRLVPKLRDMNRKDFFDSLTESLPTSELFYLVAQKTDRLPAIIKKDYEVHAVSPLSGDFELWTLKRKSLLK